MIRALVSGRLHDAPQARTSQSGNPFSTAKLRADGKDGATVWTSIIAFGELGERLATLPAGAALSVSGWRSLRRPGRLATVMRGSLAIKKTTTIDSHPGLARFLYTKANTP